MAEKYVVEDYIMQKIRLISLFLGLVFFMSSCSTHQPPANTATVDVDSELEVLLDDFFDQWVARSPMQQTRLGIKTDYGQWDSLSEAHVLEGKALSEAQLKQLLAVDKSLLSPANALNYRLMEEKLRSDIAFFPWRDHNYPLNQMFGWHSGIPSTLINLHVITDLSDANAYISRLQNVSGLLDELIVGLKRRADKGIIAPKFVFPMVIEDSKNLLKGAPFESKAATDDSVLLNDFKTKISKLDIDAATKTQLTEQATTALVEYVKPAYERLISYVEQLETVADDRAGAWKFPDGEAFYNAALKMTTTTNLTANEIHNIGLQEVARIHAEMEAIKTKVGFEGSLQDFFIFMRTDEQFYFPDTKEGREAYLDRTRKVTKEFTAELDQLFITKPKSELMVKAVEAFREKSAGKAFYQSPPPDGSRPGIYYANLYNMKEMPIYQMEALLYHEGLPGHHLQLSIATELENIPKFRKFSRYTAYIEGWGLYAELLPKEIGFYQDPYSDFGRLTLELWRACRLVTDTGLHAKKWTREQAIQYLLDNTPNVERDDRRAIERYIVMPSQATAYKIGMLKIIELREKARQELAENFDIREYHEIVLQMGAVPLTILEEQIDTWIDTKKSQ